MCLRYQEQPGVMQSEWTIRLLQPCIILSEYQVASSCKSAGYRVTSNMTSTLWWQSCISHWRIPQLIICNTWSWLRSHFETKKVMQIPLIVSGRSHQPASTIDCSSTSTFLQHATLARKPWFASIAGYELCAIISIQTPTPVAEIDDELVAG